MPRRKNKKNLRMDLLLWVPEIAAAGRSCSKDL
jgi:hypothetical protein